MHGRRPGRWAFLSAPPVTIHSAAIGSPTPSVSLAVTYRGSPLIRAASTHEHFGRRDNREVEPEAVQLSNARSAST